MLLPLQAAFLSTFFLTGLGMILYVHGAFIRAATEARVGQQFLQIEPWFSLTFAGSLLATLFWVSLDYYT